MSRALNDLHPFVRTKAERLVALAKGEGITLLVTATLRTIEEQDALYAQGRAGRPGKIVTNARGGETPHNYGLAFDVVPVDGHGEPEWQAPQPVWLAVYRAAEKAGLDALGDKWGEYVSWDPGHFQEPGWRVLVEGKVV